MKQVSGFLVVNAGGQMRVVKSRPHLSWNEVAFRVTVNLPEAWAKVQGEVVIDMPEPPPATVSVELVEPEQPEPSPPTG